MYVTKFFRLAFKLVIAFQFNLLRFHLKANEKTHISIPPANIKLNVRTKAILDFLKLFCKQIDVSNRSFSNETDNRIKFLLRNPGTCLEIARLRYLFFFFTFESNNGIDERNTARSQKSFFNTKNNYFTSIPLVEAAAWLPFAACMPAGK